MKVKMIAALLVPVFPALFAQDPNSGEYRIGTNPLTTLNYTPLALLSVAPDGTEVAVDNQGNILNGNGAAWQRLGGNLVQVSAGSRTEVWGVNAAHAVFRWSGSTWQTMPGSLQQVVVAKGGGLVLGIEWAAPHRLVRWDTTANNWAVLDGAPPIVQLTVGSPNHVYGITALGELYKLMRPSWTEWRKLKGAFKQLSAGLDGTLAGMGTDNKPYHRTDSDVSKEVASPTTPPVWTPIDAPAVYVEVINVGNVMFLDTSGMSARAMPLSSGGTLTIDPELSGSWEEKGVTRIISVYEPTTAKLEVSGECIQIQPGQDLKVALPATTPPSDGKILVNYKCKTGKFSKIALNRCTPRSGTNVGVYMLSGAQKGGCVGGNATVEQIPEGPQLDGKGTDCAPVSLRNRSAHSSVQFDLPWANVNDRIRIPAGAHNRYVFPACNRVWWDNLVFTCTAAKTWKLTEGRYDADAYCTGSPRKNFYMWISDKGYADK